MKGGLIGLVVNKTWNALVLLVVVFAVLIAVVGPQSSASLAKSTAVVSGTSTGLVFASIPEFFSSIKDGQGLISGDKPTAKTDTKQSAKTEKK